MPESDNSRARSLIDDAGGDEAILQAGMLVVECAQFLYRRFDRPALLDDGGQPAASASQATPPGTMRSNRKRWPNRRGIEPHPVLLEAQELGQAEGEGGIVAQRAEVAEMVGDALALQHQRAQRQRRAAARQTPQAASTASA
jgi:hypothetical protein